MKTGASVLNLGSQNLKIFFFLKESTGAKIVIIQDSADFDTEKPLRITGSPESVERAKNMVTEILSQNDVSFNFIILIS